VSGRPPAGATCLGALDVFVLAGGLGTRIRPVLGDTPKLLAPIGGRAYLYYLLDWLRHFGACRIVLGLGYQAQAVIEHLRRYPAKGLEIDTVIEPRPLGTAGAIRFAREALRTDPVLILNGDSFVDADLCAFVARHREAGATGTLLCTEVPDAGRYGRVETDSAGRIRRFAEKDPAFRGTASINAGLYLLSAALLDDIAAGKAASLERDVFERLPAGSLATYSGLFKFIDIGTPESLAAAGVVFGAGTH
jgi:mannose-1-phosphate guanylyltransferase